MKRERASRAAIVTRLGCASAFLLVALLASAPPATATIAYVNSASTAVASGSSCAFTLAAVTAGNTNAVVVTLASTAVSVSSISDGASTYTSRVTVNGGTTARTEIWTATIASGAGTTVTVTLSGTTRVVCAGAQYSGVALLGTTTTLTNTSKNPSISLTTQDANNWVVAGFGEALNAVATAKTGNLREAKTTSAGSGDIDLALTDNTSASATSVTNAINQGTSVQWAAAALELRSVDCSVTPSAPSLVTGTRLGGTSVALSWTSANPVVVLRKTVAFVAGDAPTNGASYSVGNTVGAATARYVGSGSFSDTGLTATTTYYYQVFANSSACYSSGAEFIATPALKWSYSTSAAAMAPPGLDPNNVVIAGSNDTNVYGIGATTGAASFSPYSTTGAIQARPPVIPAAVSLTNVNVAYMTSQDGYVYALNTGTGAQIWRSPSLASTNMLQGGTAVWLQRAVGLSVCGATTDVVFIGTRNTATTSANKVYALNGGSSTVTTSGGGNCTSTSVAPGGILWTFTGGGGNPNMDIVSSTPYIDYTNNAVWVTSRANAGTSQPSVWKFKVVDGTLAAGTSTWNFNDVDASPTPSFDGTYMYVGTVAGTLRAINLSSGTSFTHTPASGAGGVKGVPWPVSFGSVGAGIGYVNSASATVASGSSCAFTLPAVTAGSTNVVVVALPTTAVSVSSISDGASTYSSRVTINGGTTARTEIWTATIAPGAGTTVTVSLSGTTRIVCAGAQYSNVASFGNTTTNTNTNKNPSISATAADANNWIVAGFADALSVVATAKTGSLRQAAATAVGSGDVSGALTDNTGTAGTVTNGISLGTSAQWAAATLEMVPASIPDTIIFSRNSTVHSVSFDGSSFSTNWTTTLTGTPTVSAPVDDGAGNIYVGASDGKIHQLSVSTGTDSKQALLGSSTATGGDPAYDFSLGYIYVGATDGRIYGFSAPFP